MSRLLKQYFLPFMLITILSGIVFSNTFKNTFIWDDNDLIIENTYIKNFRFVSFVWSPRYWNEVYKGTKGQYRPLRTTSFMFDYALWKDNSFGYHLTNLLYHTANSILVYLILYQILRKYWRQGPAGGGMDGAVLPFACTVSALLFAAHPVHVEAVTWIKNRAELMAAFFCLLSFLFFVIGDTEKKQKYTRRSYIVSLGAFFLGFCAKETALSLPLILLIYVFCFVPVSNIKNKLIRIAPFWGMIAAYFVFKSTMLNEGLVLKHSVVQEQGSHVLTVIKTIAYYVWLLIWPVGLTVERPFMIPVSIVEPEVFISVIASVAIIVLTVIAYRKDRSIAFWILWFLAALLPVANIVFLPTRSIAEQRLYLPSVGFCCLMGMGSAILWRGKGHSLSVFFRKGMSYALIIVLLFLYSTQSFRRNADWKDAVTLWKKTSQQAPWSVRVLNNLAYAYVRQGRLEEAFIVLKKARQMDPAYGGEAEDLSDVYVDIRDPAKEMSMLKSIIAFNPRSASAYTALGVAYLQQGKTNEAIALFQEALELSPKYVQAYNNLGIAYGLLRRLDEALAMFEKAIEIEPAYAEAYDNISFVYFQMRDYDKAIFYCDKARELGVVNPARVRSLEPYRKKE